MSALKWSLVALELLIAAPALVCGSIVLVHPEGAPLGVSTALLKDSPFATFRIPGLVLAVGVGGSALAAAAALAFVGARAWLLLLGAALLLVAWIAVQVALIGYLSPMQPACAAAGGWGVLAAWHLRRAASRYG